MKAEAPIRPLQSPILSLRAALIMDRMIREREYFAEYLKNEGLSNAAPVEAIATDEAIPILSKLLKELGYAG
jgi:hypothetical protein